MYLYFSSAYPAAIKLNGIYYGVISDTVKSINVSGEPPFIEICSLVSNEQQINFIVNSSFLSSPPENVTVTDMKGGYFIKTLKSYHTDEFKVLAQNKSTDTVVTVFTENCLKISIEKTDGFFADNEKFFADSSTIQFFNLNNVNLVAVLLTGKENLLNVYKLSNNIEKVFSREVKDFEINGDLTTTEEFFDVAKHTVKTSWEFTGETFKKKLVEVNHAPKFNLENISEKIIPFAFLEELLVGGNPEPFLSDALKEKALLLKDYLGDFIGIMPPPTFRSIDEVGLIYKNGERTYAVEYCTFEITNRKIFNLKKSEN